MLYLLNTDISGLLEKIAATGPLVTFQLIVLGCVYHYLKKENARKDKVLKDTQDYYQKIVKEKDEELKELNIKLVAVVERQLSETIKNNHLIESLKELLKEALKK